MYDFNGSENACHVEAKSPEDAKQRLMAMTETRLVSPLARADSTEVIGEPSSLKCLTSPVP